MINFLPLDFKGLQEGYASGAFTPTQVIEEIQKRIKQRGEDGVWIYLCPPEELLARAKKIEAWQAEGKSLPLFGLPFAIKDNIDLVGSPTTAACPTFSYMPGQSATAVQKLIEAGAIPLGKTNLDQFATGLVGVRSPYGIPRSVFNQHYISGGSSSGSAVAVAGGLASFSLGTDTAGSGRVPAAFNNIVGLKPTRGRVSTSGVVPACRSLDCVSVFALNTPDARKILDVIEGADSSDAWSRPAPPEKAAWPTRGFRFGVPAQEHLSFFGDDAAEQLYHLALRHLEKLGGVAVEIEFAPFLETARLLYNGPWVAERLAGLQSFYRKQSETMDPVVRSIIAGAEKLSAVDTFEGIYRLQELRQKIEPTWTDIDLLVLPTTGTTYTVEEILAEPIKLNSQLGYYTNFMNLLDLCGLAVPAGFRANGLPFGITFVAPAFCDRQLCALGQRWESSRHST